MKLGFSSYHFSLYQWKCIFSFALFIVSFQNIQGEVQRQQFFGRPTNQSNFVFSNQQRAINQNGFNSRGNQFNNIIQNNNQFKEVAGFSSLLQEGNNLLERNSAGLVSRLFIDGNGRLRGATEAETVRQLREFFLTNLEKFNNNQRNTVNRFLAANGGISNGRFAIDLNSIALPDEIQKLPPDQRLKAALAALNFFLNTIQTRFKLSISPANVRNGIVQLDLSQFVRGDALALLSQADSTSKCTGKIRLNRLLAFAMDPANYYRILGVNGKNRTQVSDILGIREDKAQTVGNKIAILGKESGVASGEQRILEVQNSLTVPNSSCYRSFDTVDRNAAGIQSESRDVKLKGIFFTHDAEEWLCTGANGFMQGYLFNGQGTLINRAPAEIATQGGRLGPSIASVVSCLDCHRSGFIGGAKNKLVPKGYTERSGEIPNSPTVFRNSFGTNLTHRQFFNTNANYAARAALDSRNYIQTLKTTGAFFQDPTSKEANDPYPLLPRIIEKFEKQVDAAAAAKELGISEAQAGGLVGAKGISRTEFDSKFCNLRVGSTAPLNEAQNRDLLQRERIEPFLGNGINGNGFNGRGIIH